MNSLYALLGKAVDYAGLFPPARLGMQEAVSNYSAYILSDANWMLGRFIVPASRLDEFEKASGRLLPGPGRTPWYLSALIGEKWEQDIQSVKNFNSRHASPESSGQAVIDTLELRAPTPESISGRSATNGSFTRYFEVPLDVDPAPFVEMIAAAGSRGKMRTGGTAEAEIPPGESIVRFIRSCIMREVPYKATAGLHHPIRGRYPLTYDPGSPTGLMFGFLNVFLAGAFIAAGMDGQNALRVLDEQASDAFVVTDEGVSWRGYYLTTDDLKRSRRLNTISFGSCSFLEPADELKDHGFM